MFSGDQEFPEDLEQGCRGDYADDAAFIAKYSITLSAAKHDSGQPIAPEDLSGRITFWECKVVFNGMRGVREGWSSDGALMESYWEVLLTENQDENQDDDWLWLEPEGNAVGVAVVLDDNGSPFLVFDRHHPKAPRCSWGGYHVGKRLVEGKEWRLTNEERGRLGIGAKFRSVEQLFKEGSPSVYSDDSVEEKKAIGKKRKARTGANMAKASTDETGAKKRKASTDQASTKKGKASADETGAKKGETSTAGTGSKRRRRCRRRHVDCTTRICGGR